MLRTSYSPYPPKVLQNSKRGADSLFSSFSIFEFIYLFIYVYMSVSMCVPECVSVYVCACVPACVSVYVCACVSLCCVCILPTGLLRPLLLQTSVMIHNKCLSML